MARTVVTAAQRVAASFESRDMHRTIKEPPRIRFDEAQGMTQAVAVYQDATKS